MSLFRHTLAGVLATVALLTATPGMAQWTLDNDRSTINFVSVKNASVGEVHSFGELSGVIAKDGLARLDIDLDSVKTLIDIRNERMRELLFNTVDFPTATVTGQVDPAALRGAVGVVSEERDVAFTLSLHGQTKTVQAAVVVVTGEAGALLVYSARPVLLSASDFGLAEGVAALQKVAGLESISTSVPVTFNLAFTPTR